MSETGILAYGAYLPKARLQREAIARNHTWFAPGLKGLAKGERTMCNWDEDAVTMAVEAARDCGVEGAEAVLMASTSHPFADRQNAGIVADALALPSGLMTLDVGGSKRAGTSALSAALAMGRRALVVGSEKSRGRPASPQEMTQGDGAAALLVGQGEVIARLVAAHSEAVDFVDHFREEGEDFDYHWEERWLRDEGYLKIAPAAIRAALEQAGGAVDHFIFPAAMPRVAGMIAKAVGVAPEAVADNLQATVGETGAAHPLLMLVGALEKAKPGERILVAGFGQGADALIFEATEALARLSPRNGLTGALARRREERNYARYLAFNELIPMERGIRAEVDRNTGLSTHFRNKDMAQRMIGGKCRECGTAQFPRSRICVNPNCGAVDSQDPEPFAGKKAAISSFTVDRLTYTPDPPNYFGMIRFEGGGQLMNDFTDVESEDDLEVGREMRMMFRVKDYDTKRGFRRYFWKASPVGAKSEG